MSPLRGFDIDELFGAVRSASERVRICAEEIMDNIIVSSHETIHSNHKTSTQIHTIARQTGEEVGELQKKIDEILKQQKSFQTALDAVSVKNGLLSFLMGWLSKLGATISWKLPCSY
jgi:hypothetical protein